MSISAIVDYLLTDAVVLRTVNWVYFVIVILITTMVLFYAIYTNNRNAIRMFLFACIVWPLIEFTGIISGWRLYIGGNTALVFVLVAIFEDAGWVTLAYLAAEKLYERVYHVGGDS